MGRINGIGLVHLGVGPRDAHGVAWTTVWITFLFLPIVPLRRERVRFLAHQGTGYSFQALERGSLVPSEIARTVLFCWLVVPAIVLGPAALVVRETWTALGLPDGIHGYAIGAWIVWLVAWTWGLAEWHERRCRPPRA